MKKLFTLLLAVVASVGTMFASTKIGDLYYNLDATDQTAEVCGLTDKIRIDDNSIADWNKLPAQYVAQAICPADAAYTGLKSVKVYADAKYINILVEPNMEDLPDLSYVPFDIFLNTDNSDATGGYGDLFTDANADILLEGALFSDNNPCIYAPYVSKWWGEVGGYGWEWADPSVSHDPSDCWGAIVCEGQLPCSSQYVDGKFEIQIDRSYIPATWNNTAFGIGVEIMQNWSAVGVLPIAAPTEDNAAGWANKLTVTIDNTPYAEISGDIVIPETVNYDGVTYSVTSIGGWAFYNCSGLTSVTIPTGVTSIGRYAFDDCRGLTSVTIPNSVISIGEGTFYGCTGLTSVIWNAKNYADFASNNTPFYDSQPQITSFTFGNEVEHIPANLCNGMSNLTSIEIPNSVTSIGDYAFSGCTGLTSVIWNAKICADFRYNTPPFYDSRPQITSFTFGNEVEHIPANLCNGMSNLTSIEIPNSVTSIGDYAFSGCTGLTSVTIPNSVTSIGESAFAVCSGLKSLKVLNPNVEYSGGMPIAYSQMDSLRTIVVPAQCFPIYPAYTAYTYYYPQQLDTIEITGGELSKEVWWMISLSRKTLKSVDMAGATNTELDDEAFKEFYNLRKLILPANLTHIGYKSVAECVKLQSIDIPASVEEIDDRAFEDCRSIQTITFGGAPAGAPGRFNAPMAASQLRRIGNWAFYNAHELQNLEIPEGVEEIGDGAFYGCTYLQEMVLPSSVQSIGDNCFALCSKLTKITCNAINPPAIQAKTFYDVKRQIPVYVPADAVSAYENDPYWKEFDIQGQSEVPQGVDNIDSSSLQGGDRGRLILHNGQLFILRGDKVYDAQGKLIK